MMERLLLEELDHFDRKDDDSVKIGQFEAIQLTKIFKNIELTSVVDEQDSVRVTTWSLDLDSRMFDICCLLLLSR